MNEHLLFWKHLCVYKRQLTLISSYIIAMGGFFLTFQEYTKVKYHASVETMKIELGQL